MEVHLFKFVQEVLSMGGDAASLVFLWMMWRVDRRLVVVETKTGVKT